MNSTIIGYIGCSFLFIGFFPQTYKIIKNNSIDNISPVFNFLIIMASLFLSIYSFDKKVWPIFIANLGVLFNNLLIFIFFICKKCLLFKTMIDDIQKF